MKQIKTRIAVIITVAVLVISMLGTYLVQTNFFSVKRTDVTVTLEELVKTINENNTKYGKDLGATLTQASTSQISLEVYQPKNATESTPAPVIIGAHGWNNSKEMQYHNIVELTKRGFVFVAVDLAGHGRSDVGCVDESGWGKGNTEGTLAAVEYAMSLPFVNANEVSVVGHSAGDLALAYTIQQINVADSKKHIDSFYCPAGTMGAFMLTRDAGAIENLVLGVACGKYDELDTNFFGTYDLQTSMFAKMIFSAYNPAAMGMETLPLGKWYNAAGEITAPAKGSKLNVTNAIFMTNPPLTHPAAVFSSITTAEAVDFFYAVHGVPAGAKYLDSDSQTWKIGVVFQTIGLLAFFASSVVFAFALLKTKRYADLVRPVPVKSELPTIKSWKEILLIVVTFLPLIWFAYTKYFPCFDGAASVIKSESFPDVVNGIAWYTFASGFFAFFMISVNYGLRKLLFHNEPEKVSSVLSVCKVDNAKHFFKTVLFAAEVVFLIFIPVAVAFYVFDINFGISVYVVGLPRLKWLPEILTKYLPMWLLYLVANAALNAKTRYKEIPEWVSTAFCTLANFLPIFILTMVNYNTLVNTGATKYTFGDPSIFAFNLFAPMLLIGITNRLFYKKTGNIWLAAIVNSSILTLMAFTITRHITDFAFIL